MPLWQTFAGEMGIIDMAIVCLDTQVLYWGIRGHSNPVKDERLIQHAMGFLRWLKEERHDVIIPSIVVGEMLVAIPEDEMAEVLARFDRDWIVAAYDIRAAYHFAVMRRDHITQKRVKELRKLDPSVTRRELHADQMIIATAIAHGANTVYSHDNKLLSLAGQWIDAQNYLDIAVQKELMPGESGESVEEQQ